MMIVGEEGNLSGSLAQAAWSTPSLISCLFVGVGQLCEWIRIAT